MQFIYRNFGTLQANKTSRGVKLSLTRHMSTLNSREGKGTMRNYNILKRGFPDGTAVTDIALYKGDELSL